MNKCIFIAGIFLLTGSLAQAQAPDSAKKLIEMSVDMPDETQETDLLDKGKWQVETAYLHNNYKDGHHSSIWQGLFRYGFSEHLELRLLVESGGELERYIEQTVQSTYPVALSAKIRVVKDHAFLPDISLVTYLQIPIHKKAYWSPVFLVAFQNEFGKKWKLEYNTGVQQEAFSTRWAMVANTSIHYKVIEKLELFMEYFAQYQHRENPQHNFGGGTAYQLNNYIEFFFMAGGTINYESANHYFNGGVAFRML